MQDLGNTVSWYSHRHVIKNSCCTVVPIVTHIDHQPWHVGRPSSYLCCCPSRPARLLDHANVSTRGKLMRIFSLTSFVTFSLSQPPVYVDHMLVYFSVILHVFFAGVPLVVAVGRIAIAVGVKRQGAVVTLERAVPISARAMICHGSLFIERHMLASWMVLLNAVAIQHKNGAQSKVATMGPLRSPLEGVFAILSQ